MSSDYHVRTDCRLCGGALSEPLFDLGETALANELVDDPSEPQDTFPLYLVQCQSCQHVQLPVVVKPKRLFPATYPYQSGTSPVFREHLKRYANAIRASLKGRAPFGRVLEIGSNDGTLLRELSEDYAVLGVDPAVNIARAATDTGMTTIPMPFTSDLSMWLENSDCVIANNVLAHIDDLGDVINGVSNVLNDRGLFVFEVGYFPDVLKHGIFDVVYHEHLSYHTLRPLIPFLKNYGLYVYDAHRVDSQGGSIRVWCGPEKSNMSSQAQALLEAETDINPRRLAEKVFSTKRELAAALEGYGNVCAYGAPAKLTTLLAATGLRPVRVYDDNPLKIGKYTPGTHIPIVASDRLAIEPPDALVIASWNFAENLIPKIRKRGYTGRLVVPLPEVKVYD